MNRIYLIIVFCLFSVSVFGQGSILIIANEDCQLTIDGADNGILQKGIPKKLNISLGEHFIQAKIFEGETNKIIEVVDEKQRIVKLDFSNKEKNQNLVSNETPISTNDKLSPILVSELALTLLGGANELVGDSNLVVEDSQLFYAFEKGDEIILNADISNKNGKFYIKVYSYPDFNTIYSKSRIRDLRNHRIKIRKEGIYIIELGTTALFDRTVKLKIERIPVNENLIEYNTNVLTKYKYETIKVSKTSYYINSTSNENWKGGTSKVVVPITIPSGAIEWYYSFTASRDKDEVNKNMNKVSLFNQLTETVNGINPATKVLNIGLNLLTNPPGADYCDVYLFDNGNVQLFKADKEFRYIQEGSRENLKSSIIKLNCCINQPVYLGIRNKDLTHGIHVGVEVVGIMKTIYLEKE